MNNEELKIKLDAMQSGNKAVFEEIYTDLQTPVYTIIFRIIRDISLAEDVFQEVFVKLYRLSSKFLINNPRAYIFQMARNLAIDSLRKQPQYALLDDVENTVYLPTDDISQKMDIENAMKSLPLNECQIVTLHINGGLKFREIADITGTPLGTVLWKYQKAILKLRYKLSGGAL